MKKAVLNILATIALATGLVACLPARAGEAKTENRTTEKFSGIEVGSVFEVEILQGADCAVKLDVYDGDLLAKITTEVRKGVLYVETKDIKEVKGKFKVTITAPAYDRIGISGAANAYTTSSIKAANLKLDCSGAAEVKLAITADNVDADFSGASQVELNGSASMVSMDASGASHFNGHGFEINTCKLDASGAAKTELNVSKILEVDASGAASVLYKGSPDKKVDISGAASVKASK
ncbi:MAG: hypothetical protein FD123_2035 [Bacteroidetes bacterium]|nr:MAG: hypothetical protein FD123_2035 [Bacteroidota bacterium]